MSFTSSRRRRRSPLRSPAPGAAAPAGQQVQAAADEHELVVSRLRALLPLDADANGKAKASSRARVLQEACVYIRRLHAQVDGAAERLARLLEDHPSSVAAAVVDGTDAGAGAGAADELMLIRNLLL